MTDSTYGENKDGAGAVLKTDVLGRVKTGAQQREAILDEFERSGLSGTKSAAVEGSQLPDLRFVSAEVPNLTLVHMQSGLST